MQFIEKFMLAHPFLMSWEMDRYLAVSKNLLLASLFIFGACFACWSLAHGKLFRLSCIAYSLVFVVQAYGSWQYPELRDFIYPLIQTPVLIVGFLLLAISMYLEVRYRQAAKIQSDDSKYVQP